MPVFEDDAVVILDRNDYHLQKESEGVFQLNLRGSFKKADTSSTHKFFSRITYRIPYLGYTHFISSFFIHNQHFHVILTQSS